MQAKLVWQDGRKTGEHENFPPPLSAKEYESSYNAKFFLDLYSENTERSMHGGGGKGVDSLKGRD
jgi:hypothetical protein